MKLLEQEMKKTNKVTRETRITYLKGIIITLKDLGAKIYFQKIDHDNGFFRYSDPLRKVNLLNHRTSPFHRVGILFKTQPTLHITEVVGGTKEGIDQLLLSDSGVERLLKIHLDEQQSIIAKTLNIFFKYVHEKSILIADKDNKLAEFYLLHEFYYHIAELNLPIPKEVSHDELNKLKQAILEQIELGTKFKVKDLFEQVYERLLEKEKINRLSVKQIELLSFLEKTKIFKNFQRKNELIRPFNLIHKFVFFSNLNQHDLG